MFAAVVGTAVVVGTVVETVLADSVHFVAGDGTTEALATGSAGRPLAQCYWARWTKGGERKSHHTEAFLVSVGVEACHRRVVSGPKHQSVLGHSVFRGRCLMPFWNCRSVATGVRMVSSSSLVLVHPPRRTVCWTGSSQPSSHRTSGEHSKEMFHSLFPRLPASVHETLLEWHSRRAPQPVSC